MLPAVRWPAGDFVEVSEIVRADDNRFDCVPCREERNHRGAYRPRPSEPAPESTDTDEQYRVYRQNMAVSDVEVAAERRGPIDCEQRCQRNEGPKRLPELPRFFRA